MTDEQKIEIENWRTEYKEVCQNHRAVTDFRGKLLTLLPLASGAGIYLLLPKQSSPDEIAPGFLIAIGVFGALVTLGLFLHELRAIEQCGALIELGRSLEEKMGSAEGVFMREHNYYDNEQHTRLQHFINNLKGPIGAGWIIYSSVGVAWLFVAFLGLAKL